MIVGGLHHTSRTVSDLDRSLRFYHDLLGLKVVLEQELDGPALDQVVGLAGARLRLAELELGAGILLELIQYLSPPGAPRLASSTPADVGSHHFALLVDDIHRAHRELTTAGMRFTTSPVQISGGIFEGTWTTYCFDPDGLPVEFWQPPHASWRRAEEQSNRAPRGSASILTRFRRRRAARTHRRT